MSTSHVAAVLAAAGSGTRLGGTRKQFRELCGAPLLVQTLRAFNRASAVDAVVVVVPEGEVDPVVAMLTEHDVSVDAVVDGGPTRQASVRRGVAAVPEGIEVVLVHDAVRPFITQALIDRVVEGVREQGAAALAIPVTDTVRRSISGGLFGTTLDRNGLVRMQTPQGARLAWMRSALDKAETGDIAATDEVALLQRAGHSVRLVEGDESNFKITRPADWDLAERLWPQWHEREWGMASN